MSWLLIMQEWLFLTELGEDVILLEVTQIPKYLAMGMKIVVYYPLSYGVPVRERYGSTLIPATREQHDQNCTQSH